MSNTIKDRIFNNIIDVTDFPKPGIIYKDITPIFQNPALSKEIVMASAEHYRKSMPDAIVGLESRGFMVGFALALELNIPFILIRKKGKLPRPTFGVNYDLEYGSAQIEVHQDAIQRGMKVLIHDDVLATGGTAHAAADLVEKAGGEILGFHFITELSILNGRQNLAHFGKEIFTFAAY